MNNTLKYYDKNAESFVSNTVSVEFKETQDRFLSKLKKGDSLLDFGCGSGRDTKYFLEQGYVCEATDGSIELCEMASKLTGTHVKHMLFQELNEVEKYDGIWACSSILHVSKNDLKDVFLKMKTSLKPQGIIYTSFKYGEFEGERNGRYFTDFTVDSFEMFIEQYPNMEIIEYWITGDVRPGRGEEKWLNVILKKK